MSFNTRSGRGRGQPQAQVTYHQLPRQQFVPQSYAAPQPAPPGAGPQLQSPPQQFKMQQQAPVPTQVLAEPSTPTPPQVKMEQFSPLPRTAQPLQVGINQQTPVAQAQSPGQTHAALQGESNETTDSASKPWKKHKNPSFKVNKVQKRRRQNARFRKLLIPKNAIMVLNELQPGIQFEAEEHTNAFSQLCYSVRIEVDGVTYTGDGPSKAAAKAAAAEMAVKGLILKKIAESSLKKDKEAGEDEIMDAGSGDDASDKGSTNGRRVIPEDEVPWGSLASFALFKLFADWKAQGSNIPPVVTPSFLKPIPKAAPPKPAQPAQGVIPDNPETLHPVTLVGRVYPGTMFVELSREGNPPNLTFCLGATVNGVQYTGTAKSKKEAKKNCAINILKATNVPFNTTMYGNPA